MRRSLLVVSSLLVLIGVGEAQNVSNSPLTNSVINAPINPSKVKAVKFPQYQDLAEDLRKVLERSDNVASFEGKTGPALYDGLDDVRKAGLLNIFKKAENTRLSNGRTVFAYVQEFTELQGDRFFAVVPKELQEETENSVTAHLFYPASQLLHHPPSGFIRSGSYKTKDRYGNLELSFFTRGDESVVDIDIDDAAGVGHVFQVVRNGLTGRPTHPYAIRQILINHQNLDPGYAFEF